jgi:hypothetical protein
MTGPSCLVLLPGQVAWAIPPLLSFLLPGQVAWAVSPRFSLSVGQNWSLGPNSRSFDGQNVWAQLQVKGGVGVVPCFVLLYRSR